MGVPREIRAGRPAPGMGVEGKGLVLDHPSPGVSLAVGSEDELTHFVPGRQPVHLRWARAQEHFEF